MNIPSIQNGLVLSQTLTFLAEPAFADWHISFLWTGMAKSPQWDPPELFIHQGGIYGHIPLEVALPLRENGDQTYVTHDTAKEFAELMEQARLHEAHDQVRLTTGSTSPERVNSSKCCLLANKGK